MVYSAFLGVLGEGIVVLVMFASVHYIYPWQNASWYRYWAWLNVKNNDHQKSLPYDSDVKGTFACIVPASTKR